MILYTWIVVWPYLTAFLLFYNSHVMKVGRMLQMISCIELLVWCPHQLHKRDLKWLVSSLIPMELEKYFQTLLAMSPSMKRWEEVSDWGILQQLHLDTIFSPNFDIVSSSGSFFLRTLQLRKENLNGTPLCHSLPNVSLLLFISLMSSLAEEQVKLPSVFRFENIYQEHPFRR